jgi:glycerol-3-phosphate O-acyltransferase / dihydroxyacetone phosphate acyltransferase
MPGEADRAPATAGTAGPGAPSPAPISRPRLDALVAALARLVVRIFFRELEVVGAARLPASGPLVVVANHHNGMIDPLLIVAALSAPGAGRMPRFLGTHLLWRNPALRPWLELGGVIPIYRPKDVGAAADPAQNAAAFKRCHEQLAAGGVVALFPEGTSHSEPGLAPLKTGAARIGLEAARRFPGLRPIVAPIGLTFEAKGTFRSRALVEIGEPIDPAAEIALDRRQAAVEDGAVAGSGAASATAVRALTARIEAGLQAVTLNYGSWEQARRIGRAAELFARPAGRPAGAGAGAGTASGAGAGAGSALGASTGAGTAPGAAAGADDAPGAAAGLPGQPALAERLALHRAFIEGYAELCRRHPDAVAAAAEAVDRYDRMLRALDLRDDQVAATYPAVPAARWLGRTLLRLLVYLPLAVVGMALNWLPYRLVGEIAARATREPDMPASFKVFGGIVLFPLTWLLEAGAAAWLAGHRSRAGLAAALLTLAAAPLTGWVALRFDDRRGQLWREARAWLLLRSRRAIAAELRARREAAATEVAALADLYRSDAG